MGRRGSPPKPTSIRLWEGNLGKRPINRREPEPREGVPRCPAWLTAEAKKVWRRLVPELLRKKVLTVADGDALAAYCQTFARWKQAEEFIAKHGVAYPIRDDKGQIKFMQPFPQVAIARSLLQLIKAYQQEFGLTPSARTRIEVGDAPRRGSLAEFIAQNRRASGE